MGKSMMEHIALLPPDEQVEVLAGLDMDALMWDWTAWARPEQRPPDGHDWSIWLYLAGRGCIAGSTRILDPRTGEHVPAKDLVNVPTWVQTPYGPQFVEEGTYVKGVDRLYRVSLSNGSKVLVTLGHKFLTPQGWQPLSALLVGHRVAVDALCSQETDAQHSSAYAEDDQHCLQTSEDSLFDYQIYPSLCGQQLQSAEDISLSAVPSLVDVLEHSCSLSDADGQGSGQVCIHRGQLDTLLSRSSCAPFSLLRLDERSHETAWHAAQTLDLFRTSEQSLLSCAQSPTSQQEGSIHNRDTHEVSASYFQSSSSREELPQRLEDEHEQSLYSHFDLRQSPSELLQKSTSTLLDLYPKYQLGSLSSVDEGLMPGRQQDSLSVEQAFLRHIDAEQSLDHILVGAFDQNLQWAVIEDIEFSHVDVFYDITVPLFACYYAEGMLHHNSGKTRSAAEWVREKARITNEGQLRFLLIARTAADIRDTVVEGESGIMNISPPSEKPHYEPSKRRLTWPNGNMAVLLSADEPDSARGVQAHYTWADELAAWRQSPDAAGMTSWDNVRVATRLGLHPQIIATTTPKRIPILYSLISEAEKTKRVVISKGSTMDNAGNLSETYLEAITGVYAGTRLAQQELYGEMLDDVEGALWTLEMLEASRQGALPPSAPLRVIGVDPSVAENPRDECGIIVCASTADRDLYKRHAWVMEDASILGSPEVWASKVVEMARRWGAPVVAEVNQGGALVRNAINAIDPNVKVLEVHSKYGKALRAEPTVLAYEQNRVHHIGYLPDLEAQMTSWIPGETRNSPDRVDALVHALTALLIKPPQGFLGGKLTAKSPAARRIPSDRGQGPSGSSGGRSSRGGRVFSVR